MLVKAFNYSVDLSGVYFFLCVFFKYYLGSVFLKAASLSMNNGTSRKQNPLLLLLGKYSSGAFFFLF